MNPSFAAFQKAMMPTFMNTLMGIEPPAPKKKQLNQTDGKLFAQSDRDKNKFPRSDMVEAAEAERDVQAHLAKLRQECIDRAQAK